ncbi:MAG: cysteine desulfurase / selenocysteine lyase [Actinomycetota bacterium]|jgi:cysteine desulfurase/selenocysteine lyase|nr:cysteine desulfurase / selenocysteine lyase [Actinomycetota bacterium]
MLDAEVVRKDFPIFETLAHGKRLVYLDSAATAQKPRFVIDRMVRFYETENANVHRGIYELGEKATAAFESAREKCAAFIGARDPRSIIFTRGTTESINLVRFTWAKENVKAGDEILITEMEHHSNLIPWQLLAAENGAVLRHLPIDDEGILRLDLLDEFITDRTKLVALSLMSNVLGTINPVRKVADAAHAVGARVLVDAAQGAPHLGFDVNELDADFLAFSAHKLCGPTGAGVLYGRTDLLEEMPPFHGGGEMIREVWADHATWADIPYKFEAGTMNAADVVGMGAAIEYLESLGMDAVREHEKSLAGYAIERLTDAGATVYGPRDLEKRGGAVAFNVDGVHPHDMATIVDQEGVCIRAGHHCAQPLMRRLGVPATARASLYIYNDERDVDALIDALDKAKGWFA